MLSLYTHESIEEVERGDYKLNRIIKQPDGSTLFIYRYKDLEVVEFEL